MLAIQNAPNNSSSTSAALKADGGLKTSNRKPRQKFTQEEDEIMYRFVEENGPTGWHRIVPLIPSRTARQCRERWKNYLAPNVNHDPWTPEEDRLLEEKVQQFGQSWSKIVAFFPNRTDVIIKNRYALLKRHSANGRLSISYQQVYPQPCHEFRPVCSQEQTVPIEQQHIFPELVQEQQAAPIFNEYVAEEVPVEVQEWYSTETFSGLDVFDEGFFSF